MRPQLLINCYFFIFFIFSLLLGRLGFAASIIEEITVTAQKREQNAQDVSIAIAAYSGDQLHSLGTTTARQLADNVAGVQISMQNANAPTFTIRGVNVNDFSATTAPAAAVYLDGIYKASNQSSGVQLFDIERVEILKGPQGTLWGKNTTGGAVSVTTRKPGQELDGYVQLGYGGFDRFEFEGAVGKGLTDTLSGRVSVQYIESDGPFDNVTFPTSGIVPGSIPPSLGPNGEPAPEQITRDSGFDPDPGNWETLALRGQLLWEPNNNLQVLLIGHYAEDNGEEYPFVSIFEDPDIRDNNVSVDLSPVKDNEFWGVTADIRWDVDPGTLVSITGWDNFEREGGGLDLPISTGTAILIPAATPFAAQLYYTGFEQLSQELRYEVESDNLFWMIGGFYSEAEFDQASLDEGRGSIGNLGGSDGYFDNPFLFEDRTLAAFGHVEWGFNEQFKLIGGLRYSDEKRERKIYQVYFGPDVLGQGLSHSLPFPALLLLDAHNPTILGSNPHPNTFNSDEISYRIGLDWTPTETLLAYFTHAKGLKSGGFDSSLLFNIENLEPIEDEEVLSYEIGFKWDPLNNFRLNAALFYYDYTNAQQRIGVSDAAIPGMIQLTNLKQVDIYGVEAEAMWSPVSGLEFSANVSFLDTEINDTTVTSQAFPGTLIDGNKFPYAPDFAAGLLGRYEFPLTSVLTAALQVNVNYTGDHFATVENISSNEQNYTLVDIRGTILSSSGWELSAFGHNLTNEIYITNATIVGNDLQLSTPRTWGVQIHYQF